MQLLPWLGGDGWGFCRCSRQAMATAQLFGPLTRFEAREALSSPAWRHSNPSLPHAPPTPPLPHTVHRFLRCQMRNGLEQKGRYDRLTKAPVLMLPPSPAVVSCAVVAKKAACLYVPKGSHSNFQSFHPSLQESKGFLDQTISLSTDTIILT